MGQLASEHVAAHFEQATQIRNLESHYDEALAMAEATAPVRAPQPVAVQQPRFAEQVSAK
jgi:hypothetical protein